MTSTGNTVLLTAAEQQQQQVCGGGGGQDSGSDRSDGARDKQQQPTRGAARNGSGSGSMSMSMLARARSGSGSAPRLPLLPAPALSPTLHLLPPGPLETPYSIFLTPPCTEGYDYAPLPLPPSRLSTPPLPPSPPALPQRSVFADFNDLCGWLPYSGLLDQLVELLECAADTRAVLVPATTILAHLGQNKCGQRGGVGGERGVGGRACALR